VLGYFMSPLQWHRAIAEVLRWEKAASRTSPLPQDDSDLRCRREMAARRPLLLTRSVDGADPAGFSAPRRFAPTPVEMTIWGSSFSRGAVELCSIDSLSANLHFFRTVELREDFGKIRWRAGYATAEMHCTVSSAHPSIASTLLIGRLAAASMRPSKVQPRPGTNSMTSTFGLPRILPRSES
jgi:hypothetical protein